MWSLALLVLLSAPDGGVVIVPRSTLGLATPAADRAREQLRTALEHAGLTATVSATACADHACLVTQASERRACALGVTLVKGRKDLAVDLEAVVEGAVVLQQSLSVVEPSLEQSQVVTAFAEALAAKLRTDRPVAEAPLRLDRPPSVEVTQEQPPAFVQARPLSPVLVGGLAGGVAAVGVGLLVGSGVVKGQLDMALQPPVVTALTRPQAEQQAALANGLLGGGLVALGLGVAGGVTALVLALSN
jgi:hypothetical protein